MHRAALMYWHQQRIDIRPRMRLSAYHFGLDIGYPVQRRPDIGVHLLHILHNCGGTGPFAKTAIIAFAIIGKTRTQFFPITPINRAGIRDKQRADRPFVLRTQGVATAFHDIHPALRRIFVHAYFWRCQ